VIANDLSEDHLKVLHDSLSYHEQERIKIIHGDALDLGNVIGENCLAGILAANWLHFLEPADVRRAFKMFFKLLRPDGKLCVTTCGTNNGFFRGVAQLAAERKANGDKWPGLVSKDQYEGGFKDQSPERVNLMDPDVLEREAKLAGFTVVKTGFVNLGAVFEGFRAGGQEGSGLLAVKPYC